MKKPYANNTFWQRRVAYKKAQHIFSSDREILRRPFLLGGLVEEPSNFLFHHSCDLKINQTTNKFAVLKLNSKPKF